MDTSEKLWAINAHEQALWNQLRTAEKTLNSLFNARENIIRSMNGGKWDKEQYRLDDLQQLLTDTIEFLGESDPFCSLLNKQ